MSVSALKWAQQQTCPNLLSQTLLERLGWYADEFGGNGVRPPTAKWLADKLHRSERSVRYALADLVKAELIEPCRRKRPDGGDDATEYRLKIRETRVQTVHTPGATHCIPPVQPVAPLVKTQEEVIPPNPSGLAPHQASLFEEPEPPASTSTQTKAKKAKPRSQIKADWWPDKAGREFGKRFGIDNGNGVAEVGRFIDYHTAKGNLMADWNAAWRTWCRNHPKFEGAK